MEFFHWSKIIWTIIQPGNALIIVGFIGLILVLLRDIGFLRRMGEFYIVFALVGMFAVASLPIDNLFMRTLELRHPIISKDKLPDKVDGIIILGGAVSPRLSLALNQTQITAYGERITAMLELMKKYPRAKVVYTGGSGSLLYQEKKEADIVKEWLKESGFNNGRVVFENKSRNTFENAAYSKILVKPKKNETWLLVTSAFHMPRSKAVFDTAEWDTIPYPVDFQTTPSLWDGHQFDLSGNLSLWEVALHEYMGFVAYKLSGKIE